MPQEALLTQEKLFNLEKACRYWELAKMSERIDGRIAKYIKAHLIFLKELGEKDPITLEIRKEMLESFSYQTVFQTAVPITEKSNNQVGQGRESLIEMISSGR